jgi:hypothetical protein
MRKNRLIITSGTILFLVFLILTTASPSQSSPQKNVSLSSRIDPNSSGSSDVHVPDCVQAGDLLFVDWKFDVGEDESTLWLNLGPYNDHAALYIGNNTFVDAASQGVSINDYYHFYYWTKNLVFLRVSNATESQRNAAVAWAINKIGLSYQNFFSFPWFGLKIADTTRSFPTAHNLYCMELLWAAYYNQGIDIDHNEWKFPWWVTGEDILHDNDVTIIYMELKNSTEITKPYKGIYAANKKIFFTVSKTIIFGGIDVEVTTYNDNITRVDFYIDGVYKSTDITPPYIWYWNERVFGKKMVKAIAYDDSANQYYTAITIWKFF